MRFDANGSESPSLGTVWPATLLHWHFASLHAPISAGQGAGKLLRSGCRWGRVSEQPWADSNGRKRCCGQSFQMQLQLGVDSLVLVLRANCSDSWPTAAQQRRAAEGWKTSRFTNISAKCLHNSFLPAASSGHSPSSLKCPAKSHTCLGLQASISSTPTQILQICPNATESRKVTKYIWVQLDSFHAVKKV